MSYGPWPVRNMRDKCRRIDDGLVTQSRHPNTHRHTVTLDRCTLRLLMMLHGVDGVINVSGCGARGASNYDASLDKSRET